MSNYTNQEWLEGLKAHNPVHLQALQSELSKGLQFAFHSKLEPHQLMAFVDDIAQNSILKILDKLDHFGGKSRFLTWAVKIAVRTGLSELRRARWKDTSLDELIETGYQFTSSPQTAQPQSHPELTLLQKEVLTTINDLLKQKLSHQQRTVLLSILVFDMSIDEIAVQMNLSRNAIYKTIHDARRRLKAALDETGLTISAILQIFS